MFAKLFASTLALAVLVTAAPLAGAADEALVTVTLAVDHLGDDLDKTCGVQVPAGSNGLAVLDRAQADGCILGYTTEDHGFGAYVTSIDYVPGLCYTWPAACTYWAVYENGAYASVGVSDLRLDHGDVLGFTYEGTTAAGPL